MFNEKKYTEEELNELKELGEHFKEDDCCVCINVFTKCGKEHSWKRENNPCEDEKAKKQNCCVFINVFTKCEKEHSWKKEEDHCKDKKERKQNSSVCINVFKECED